MGMDIQLCSNVDASYEDDYLDEKNDFFHLHNLSRTFCNFMSRKNVVDGEAELDQIGKLIQVDISPLYEMEEYPSDESEMVAYLEFVDSEEEKQEIRARTETSRIALQHNLPKVLETITAMLEKLVHIQHLPSSLLQTTFDTLDNKTYFADFQVDKGDGYIGNNFGQDLRNFKRYLDYVQSKGATTVWFHYG
jgi:hypothetical protein